MFARLTVALLITSAAAFALTVYVYAAPIVGEVARALSH